MPTIDCSSALQHTAFYVEGVMEQIAFKAHFGIKAKIIGTNGDAVSISAIAKAISTDLKLRKGVINVFIIFDREGRTDSCDKLKSELIKLMKKDFPKINFHVAIPDRDIECWLFADVEAASAILRKKLGARVKLEGSNGAESLKKYIGEAKYEKIAHGVKIFGKVSWQKICAKSKSANDADIAKFFPGCAWIKS